MPTEETEYAIKKSDLEEMLKLCEAIETPKVRYQTDQLKMANETINLNFAHATRLAYKIKNILYGNNQ